MEYMDGGTLQDVVRQTRLAEGEMAAVRDAACASQSFDMMAFWKRWWEQEWLHAQSLVAVLLLCPGKERAS